MRIRSIKVSKKTKMKEKKNSIPHIVLLALCLIIALLSGLAGTARADDYGDVDAALTDEGTGFIPTTQKDAVKPGDLDNGIPVLYLNIDEDKDGYGTIEEMINSPKHQDSCYGSLSIEVPAGFHYVDFPDLKCESLENLEMTIRGRGNSTWERCSKKPFKIKLESKADIFGLGKNKHWVLVANAMDVTMLKDRMTAWLGEQMGFDFTPRGVPVDVVLTGKYYGTHYIGSYYLSENVRVDKNRLEIAELEESDTEMPTITGGYLLQQSSQVRPGSPDKFDTTRGAKWATDTPSFDTEEASDDDEHHGPFGDSDAAAGDASATIGGTANNAALQGDAYNNEAQQKYIQTYIQDFEDVLFDGTTAYSDLMDVESAAKYWLFNTLSMNSDAYGTGSTYIYKDRDSEDGTVSKIYWGPLWDFDFAWDVLKKPEGFEYYHVWLKPMFCDRTDGGFIKEVYKQWAVMKEKLEELIKAGGILDQYAAETLKTANSNNKVWPKEGEFDYLKEVDKLKDWINRRIAWMDANFEGVNDLAHKVTFVVDGETYDIAFLGYDEEITGKEEYPKKDGYTFLGWEDGDGNIIKSAQTVDKDMTLTAKYIPDDEVTHAADIAFSKNCDIVRYNEHVFLYMIPYTVLPEDADDKIVEWSSSDEANATVDQDGVVNYFAPGTYIFTAKLKSGKTRTFTLYAIEDDVPVPQDIYPDEEVIYMTVGSQSPCSISTKPSPAKIYQDEYEYASDDESVVTVGENGVLTAVGLGETKVHIKAPGVNADGDDVMLETVVTVIVTEQPDYTIKEGSTATWTEDSSEGLTLTVKRSVADETCFSHFIGVALDGKTLVRDKEYTAAPGSTIITINAEVLDALAAGKHTITVMFDDGEEQVTLEIKAAAPETGDKGGMIWMLLMAAALIGLTLAFALRRKSENS